jgi:hypothetical protein
VRAPLLTSPDSCGSSPDGRTQIAKRSNVYKGLRSRDTALRWHQHALSDKRNLIRISFFNRIGILRPNHYTSS